MKADGAPFPTTLKPWWKSVGFWMGALVALGFGWTTIESVYYTTSLYYVSTGEVSGITNADASVQIHHVKFVPTSGYLSPSSGWHYERILSYFSPSLEQEYVGILGRWALAERKTFGSTHLQVLVSIPLWFVFAMWNAVWFGAWTFQRKRIRWKMEVEKP